MAPRFTVRLLSVLSSSLLALAGCARDEGRPCYPVRGTILYEGKPVPHAFVVLHPAAPEGRDGSRPSAVANAKGEFALTSRKARDGAPTGAYVATVEWRPIVQRKGEYEPGPNRLPTRYSKPETSGLRIQVTAGDNELPPLALKK
jgi:hypothetical protein